MPKPQVIRTARRRRGRPPHADVLTPAEWRIVMAVRHGMTNRTIATRRGISLDAVKYHLGNIFDKLGLADRQALRRWDGVPRHSLLHHNLLHLREKGMNAPIKLDAIGQISRSVKDIKQAEAWYGQVLGLSHLYTFGNLAFFDCGGTRLYLQEAAEPGPESVLYLRVENIHAAQSELEARGVEFTGAPHMIHKHADGTEEWMTFFKDLEGRPLALMSQVAS